MKKILNQMITFTTWQTSSSGQNSIAQLPVENPELFLKYVLFIVALSPHSTSTINYIRNINYKANKKLKLFHKRNFCWKLQYHTMTYICNILRTLGRSHHLFHHLYLHIPDWTYKLIDLYFVNLYYKLP